MCVCVTHRPNRLLVNRSILTSSWIILIYLPLLTIYVIGLASAPALHPRPTCLWYPQPCCSDYLIQMGKFSQPCCSDYLIQMGKFSQPCC